MYVFTIPKVLRAIFRKRRKLLTHLFQQSIEALKLWMQTTLELPHGQIAAIAVIHTFGDYLGFHPHRRRTLRSIKPRHEPSKS